MSQNQAVKQQVPSVQLMPAAAIEQIKEQFPDAARTLDAVLKKDIIALATDEAFALRDKDDQNFKESLFVAARKIG